MLCPVAAVTNRHTLKPLGCVLLHCRRTALRTQSHGAKVTVAQAGFCGRCQGESLPHLSCLGGHLCPLAHGPLTSLQCLTSTVTCPVLPLISCLCPAPVRTLLHWVHPDQPGPPLHPNTIRSPFAMFYPKTGMWMSWGP